MKYLIVAKSFVDIVEEGWKLAQSFKSPFFIQVL